MSAGRARLLAEDMKTSLRVLADLLEAADQLELEPGEISSCLRVHAVAADAIAAEAGAAEMKQYTGKMKSA